MVKQHIILERKDLGDLREGGVVIAVPESSYHTRVKKVYEIAGTLSGLDKSTFQYHDHWRFNYLPIELGGSIRIPSETAITAVAKGLETVCDARGLRFDQTRMLKDPAITSQILDYEIVDGAVYIARFIGKSVYDNKKDVRRSVAFVVAPTDGEVTVDQNKIFIGGQVTDFPRNDLRSIVQSNNYTGNLDVFNAGNLSLHRKTLRPYKSRGRFGSPHSNGPWILLEKDVSAEHVNLIAKGIRDQRWKKLEPLKYAYKAHCERNKRDKD